MVAPWSPSVPLTSSTSPGLRVCAPQWILAGIAPIPAVLINSLSAAPRCTTLVSPVTMAMPASRAVAAMLLTTVFSVSIGRPSSRINPQER
ncbi:hypothetical protein D3C73_1284430 [compost metagenome]